MKTTLICFTDQHLFAVINKWHAARGQAEVFLDALIVRIFNHGHIHAGKTRLAALEKRFQPRQISQIMNIAFTQFQRAGEQAVMDVIKHALHTAHELIDAA